MRLGIFVPAYDERLHSGLAFQLIRDTNHGRMAGHDVSTVIRHSCDLVWSRNKALDEAVRSDWDFLMMVDADVYCDAPEGALMPMLKTAQETDATMVVAVVPLRTVTEGQHTRVSVEPFFPGRVYEADKAGTGLVLIDLRKVREWYCLCNEPQAGTCEQCGKYSGPCFYRLYEDGHCAVQKTGLDIWFSKHVVREQNGGLVVCDARIPTVHVNACHRYRFPDPAGDLGQAEPAVKLVSATGA